MDIKNVVVLGCSYSGSHAAEVLAKNLPSTHRVVVIDRNSHFNNLYAFPRFGVVPGHEHKAFVPLANLLPQREEVPVITGPLASSSSSSATASSSSSSSSSDEDEAAESLAASTSGLSLSSDSGASTRSESQESGSSSLFSTTNNSSATSLSASIPEFKSPRSLIVQASVTRIGDGWVEVDRKLDMEGLEEERDGEEGDETIEQELGVDAGVRNGRGSRITFDYMVYALGSTLPAPILSNAYSKLDSMTFLKTQQQRIAAAREIVIIGGGALGIQYACDIADYYGTRPSGCPSDAFCACAPNLPTSPADKLRAARGGPKTVTLVASRRRLLPMFEEPIAAEAKRRLRELGVEVRWQERVKKGGVRERQGDERRGGANGTAQEWVVELESGRRLFGDCVLVCTGQKPHTDVFAAFEPRAVDQRGFVRVGPTLQVHAETEGENSTSVAQALSAGRIFAIGDCVDNGAIKAGHTGWNMGEIAAKNIQKLVEHENALDNDDEDTTAQQSPSLEAYKPSLPMIKLTLGLNHAATQLVSPHDPNKLDFVVKTDCPEDMNWHLLWKWAKHDVSDPFI